MAKGKLLILTNSELKKRRTLEKLLNYVESDDDILVNTVDEFSYGIYQKYGHCIGAVEGFTYLTNDHERRCIFLRYLRDNYIDASDLLKPVWKDNIETTLFYCLEKFAIIKQEEFIYDGDKYTEHASSLYYPIYSHYTTAMYNAEYLDKEDVLVYALTVLQQDWILKIYKISYSNIFLDAHAGWDLLENLFIKTLIGYSENEKGSSKPEAVGV